MDTNSQPLSFCQKLFNLIICKIPVPTTATTRTTDPDIGVEFNHTNSQQNSNQINQPRIVEKGTDEKDQKQQDRGKKPRKSVTIKEPVEELGEKMKKKNGAPVEELGEKMKKNGANGEGSGNKLNDQSHESHAKPKPPRHWGPLLSVASNINEKADAFIRRKKKDLGDQDKKS